MKKITLNLLSIINYTKEELLTIVKDPAILLVFFIANIIYPIIYSIAYQPNQIKDVSIAIIDNDNTVTSRELRSMLDATEGIRINYKTNSMDEAKYLFYQSKVHGIILLPKGFEKDILSGVQSSLSIYTDASYFLIYKQVYSSTVFAYKKYIEDIQIQRALKKGLNYAQATTSAIPLNVKTAELYNPSASYGSFVMPPLILVILQQTLLIGIGILGGTRKEIKRYSDMLSINNSRRGILKFILGKGFAYFITFMIIGIFDLVWIHHWYGYVDKSSYLEILSLYIPYITANIFLGMSISVFFKRRENALLFMVFLSVPILFFSGATWPVESIPSILRKISFVFPSTVMIPAYLRIRLMGAELHHVRVEIYAMLAQCVIYSVLAYFAFKHVMKQIIQAAKTTKPE